MRRSKPAAFLLVLLAAFVVAAPALAEVISPEPLPGARAGPNTELTFTSLGPGQGVAGFLANVNNPFDPIAGYPPGNPGAGFTRHDVSFAGVLNATPTGGGGGQLQLYCIDIRTFTRIGLGYELGEWDEATVPNVGYVAQLLSRYFPTVPSAPAGLASDNARAAATQAAIWYFTDRFVVHTDDPLRSTVEAIVVDVLSRGPVVEPDAPSIDITPGSANGPVGSIVGPFTVTSTVESATVRATGATMYSDPEGTTTIANEASVPSGQQIWLRRSTGPPADAAILEATARATVPSGNVYLYDGNTSGTTEAQKLILARTATLETTVKALATFREPGSLTVRKTIAGPAAGQQGAVTISVRCGGIALETFVIPAGATGIQSRTYANVPGGTSCTVTETVDGRTPTVSVVVVGSGQQVGVPVGGTVTAELTDTYSLRPGVLLVRKTIGGPAAGQQGAISITVTCDPGPTLEPFTIPAGALGGTQERLYVGIPAGARCTIAETANGSTTAVSVVVVGSGEVVTVPPADGITATLTDTYTFNPGSLVVTKTVGGPAAGQQGAITITVTCNNTVLQPLFVIAAVTAAGDVSQTYANIPGNAVCTIVETADGATPTVTVTTVGSPRTVTILPGVRATANVTDTYAFVPGSLLVTKTITGSSAGQQGEIIITVNCGGTALPDFVIPAGTPAGVQSQRYRGHRSRLPCAPSPRSPAAPPRPSR